MKTAGFILLLAAVSATAQTNQTPFCCRNPIRIFNESQTVNLKPLFQWWMQREKEDQGKRPGTGAVTVASLDYADPNRPLAAWKRVTGVKVQETDFTWVVDAEVAIGPTTRTNELIILKNPPTAEEQQYYNLKPLPAQYKLQITNDARAYQADLKAEQNAEARANTEARSLNLKARWRADGFNQEAARERDAADAALNDKLQNQQALDQVQKQLDAIPSVNGRYQVDCFAMESGRNSQGLPIFDPGEVSASPR